MQLICLDMPSLLHMEADVVKRECDRGRESGRPKTLSYYFQVCPSLACETWKRQKPNSTSTSTTMHDLEYAPNFLKAPGLLNNALAFIMSLCFLNITHLQPKFSLSGKGLGLLFAPLVPRTLSCEMKMLNAGYGMRGCRMYRLGWV